jgi:hypothetical protein
MMNTKRILFCLLGGVISAGICLLGSQVIFGFQPLDTSIASSAIANRLLLGFVIGISSWNIQHHLHGILLGLIISLSISIGFLPTYPLKFILYTGAGIFYGWFIDWLASDIFLAPKNWIHPR